MIESRESMKKLYLLLTFFTTLLYSSDIVTIYEEKGTKEAIKAMDRVLESREYWQKKLANYDLRFGLYSKNRHLLICDKSKKSLKHLLVKKNSLVTVSTMPVVTGRNGGDKEREGDLKTPIGVYSLTKKLTNLDQFYGPFALATDYPNLYDKIRGKNGSGIWIHGMPLSGEKKLSTRGCIALKNSLLKKLEHDIDFKKSVLWIYEDEPKMADPDEIISILSTLYRWRNSWKNSDFERYISFYDDTFVRYDGKKLDSFKRVKKSIFSRKKGKDIEIVFQNIEVVPYQTTDDKKLYRVTFFEKYDSGDYRFNGDKELYFLKRPDGWKIIAEK